MVLCQIELRASAIVLSRSYIPPAATGDLLGLAVLRVLPVARAELLQHEPVRVVPFVLFGVIVALFTLGTRQRNEHSIRFFSHCCSPLWWRAKGPAESPR